MCEWGNEICVCVRIPADLSSTGKARWKHIGVDACIAPLVEALQKGGINMRASCCGHGKAPGEILFEDGRVLRIYAPTIESRCPKCGLLKPSNIPCPCPSDAAGGETEGEDDGEPDFTSDPDPVDPAHEGWRA